MRCSLDGNMYTFSEAIDYMEARARACWARHVDSGSLEGFVYSLLWTRSRACGELRIVEAISVTSPARKPLPKNISRHFWGIQGALGNGELGNVFWLPGTENPVGGLTKVKIDMVPVARALQTGSCFPDALRSLIHLFFSILVF